MHGRQEKKRQNAFAEKMFVLALSKNNYGLFLSLETDGTVRKGRKDRKDRTDRAETIKQNIQNQKTRKTDDIQNEQSRI